LEEGLHFKRLVLLVLQISKGKTCLRNLKTWKSSESRGGFWTKLSSNRTCFRQRYWKLQNKSTNYLKEFQQEESQKDKDPLLNKRLDANLYIKC
jgi:hypothetical protein